MLLCTHSRVASLEAERANLKKVITDSENAASSQGDLIQVPLVLHP